MPKAARLTDPSTHGGTITSSASKTYIEGKLAARLTDQHLCPKVRPVRCKHNTGNIVSASSTVSIEGKRAARVGDNIRGPCGCACTISAGATKVDIGG